MKRFRAFINEESDYYYHGTANHNVDSILKNGLNSEKSLHKGTVFLTTNHGMASKYSKSGKGKLGTVLKVHKDAINPEHVKSNSAGVVEYGSSIHPSHISKV